MKYGYLNENRKKSDLSVAIVAVRSSLPKVSKTDLCETKDRIRIDEIRAGITPMQLHLTLG